MQRRKDDGFKRGICTREIHINFSAPVNHTCSRNAFTKSARTSPPCVELARSGVPVWSLTGSKLAQIQKLLAATEVLSIPRESRIDMCKVSSPRQG